MPLPQNFNAVLGASVFGIVCAATLYVLEHYRQDRRRHAMAQDLARLDSELANLRAELNKLLALQKEKSRNSRKRGKREGSILSSSTAEDYASAQELDSDELEFFDVSDDEESLTSSVDQVLKEIDKQLQTSSESQINQCLDKLENLFVHHQDDPYVLSRIGHVRYKLAKRAKDNDVALDYIAKGVDACEKALDIKPNLADAHKWYALLVGLRTDFKPIKEKINDGKLFKEHLDIAVKLNPNDGLLHHMLGRYAFYIATLNWIERKAVEIIFAEIPVHTYKEALDHFLEAERVGKPNWKENKLFIAKCKIGLNEITEALKILDEADKIIDEGWEMHEVDNEVKELLKKYSNYR